MQGDEPELAGMRGGAGDQHAARVEQRLELLVGSVARGPTAIGARRSPDLDQRVDGDRRGRRRATMSGLTSMLRTSGRAAATSPRPTSTSIEPLAIDRRLAAELAEQLLRGEARRSSRRRRRESAAPAGTRHRRSPRRGRPRRRASRLRRTAGRGACPAMSSRLPLTIGATSSDTAPSSAVALPSSSVAAALDSGVVAEAQLDESALGLVGDRVAAELDDHRECPSSARSASRPRRRWPPLARRRSARRTRGAAPWTRTQRG